MNPELIVTLIAKTWQLAAFRATYPTLL